MVTKSFASFLLTRHTSPTNVCRGNTSANLLSTSSLSGSFQGQWAAYFLAADTEWCTMSTGMSTGHMYTYGYLSDRVCASGSSSPLDNCMKNEGMSLVWDVNIWTNSKWTYHPAKWTYSDKGTYASSNFTSEALMPFFQSTLFT